MTENTVPGVKDMIKCEIDGVECHSIQIHLKNEHPEWTIQKYQDTYPSAPIFSDYAKVLQQRQKEKRKAAGELGETLEVTAGLKVVHGSFHDVFDLGPVPAALSSQSGAPIRISVMSNHNQESIDFLPDLDPDYVFNIDLTKKVIMGFELNKPVYLWGFHGTGKTTVLQQSAARTKRPFMRVQHSLNMQESDVLGQWTVKDGSTQFQLGPLPTAMINGWVYCADEYDTAMPNVTTVYQPVLEGQALIIKDAPPVFRKIIPHPDFRFVATGNTNGIGDETGLYQGTIMQNAANYSRFGITEEVKYMEADLEIAVLQSKSKLTKTDAKKIVNFGNRIREQFSENRISMTVSPRELINAADLGIAYGGNWEVGLELAFANRLSRIDGKVVKELLQRQFGK